MILNKEQLQIVTRQALVMTKASLKNRYRSTWGGFVWVLLFPILIFSAQAYAFHYILKIQMENYLLFLLSGLIPWIFISSSIDMGTATYVNYGTLLKSLPINPLSLLVSQVADNFLNYLIAFTVILIPIAFSSQFDFSRLISFLPAFISVLLFVVGLAHLLATVNVFYRDVRFVVSFILQVSLFLTPIFYPRQLIPPALEWYVHINLFALLLAPFQTVAVGTSMDSYGADLAISFLVSLSIIVISIVYWKRKKNEIYFRL